MIKTLKTQVLTILIVSITLFTGLSCQNKKQPLDSVSNLPCNGASGKAHSKGGGFVASTAKVASTAYVGPQAQVCEQAKVSGYAQIFRLCSDFWQG